MGRNAWFAIVGVGMAFMACSPFSSGSGDDAPVAAADASAPDASAPDASVVTKPDGAVAVPLTDALLAYWNFNDNAVDKVHGVTLQGDTGCALAYSPTGQHNQSLKDDVSDQTATVGCSPVVSSSSLPLNGDFTIAMWVRYDSTAVLKAYPHLSLFDNGQFLVGVWSADGGVTFHAMIQVDGLTTVYFPGPDLRTAAATSYALLTAYRRKNTLGISVNGAPPNEMSFTDNVPALNVTTYFGREKGGFQWAGTMDDVAIWTRALSPADIQELYGNGMGGVLVP